MYYRGAMRFAHRGLVRRAPENTIEAIQAAYDFGCEGVEIDVRSTSDGHILVVHDAEVTRIVSGGPDDGRTDRVAELRRDELVELSLPYANHLLPELPPEGINKELLYPRLVARQLGRELPHVEQFRLDPRIAHPLPFEELLRWVLRQQRALEIEVECKEPGLVPGLRAAFERVGGGERCILFSGEAAVVEELCEGFPRPASGAGSPRRNGVRVGTNARRLSPDRLDEAKRLGLDAIDLNSFETSSSEVEALHRAGFLVFANLGDLPGWWEKLEEWGFDGFKTNYAEEYTAWWAARRG